MRDELSPAPSRLRMLLLEAADSPHSSRIEHAANEAGVTVRRVDTLAAVPADAPLVGVGPSIRDPLDVARHLRDLGGQALLVFFTGSSSARDGLQAELLRDPFLYPRYELIEIPDNPRQLATHLGRVVEHAQLQLHPAPSGRGRRRPAARPAAHAQPTLRDDVYLANIVAQASDAIFAADEALCVTMWNPAAERLFGFTAESAVGQPLEVLDLPGASARQLGALVRRVVASSMPEQAQVRCATANQGPIEIDASVAFVRGARGLPLGISIIARDNSHQRGLEDALRDARRQKDELLAIVSHELRTPLTSILGYTDMLLRGLAGPLTPVTNRYLGNVRTAGDRLLELVTGLLDYTRLESGAERLNVDAIDLPKLVRQCVQHFQAQAEVRQIVLRMVTSRGPARVVADAEKIDHVLRSILSNALKFTPDGGWIAVRIGKDPDAHETVRVSVADSGIGLENEQVLRVWERFYQGDASLTRPYGGMGLGLSIARHLVTLHGGTVGAASAGPGLGSTFWFSLPLARTT